MASTSDGLKVGSIKAAPLGGQFTDPRMFNRRGFGPDLTGGARGIQAAVDTVGALVTKQKTDLNVQAAKDGHTLFTRRRRELIYGSDDGSVQGWNSSHGQDAVDGAGQLKTDIEGLQNEISATLGTKQAQNLFSTATDLEIQSGHQKIDERTLQQQEIALDQTSKARLIGLSEQASVSYNDTETMSRLLYMAQDEVEATADRKGLGPEATALAILNQQSAVLSAAITAGVQSDDVGSTQTALALFNSNKGLMNAATRIDLSDKLKTDVMRGKAQEVADRAMKLGLNLNDTFQWVINNVTNAELRDHVSARITTQFDIKYKTIDKAHAAATRARTEKAYVAVQNGQDLFDTLNKKFKGNQAEINTEIQKRTAGDAALRANARDASNSFFSSERSAKSDAVLAEALEVRKWAQRNGDSIYAEHSDSLDDALTQASKYEGVRREKLEIHIRNKFASAETSRALQVEATDRKNAIDADREALRLWETHGENEVAAFAELNEVEAGPFKDALNAALQNQYAQEDRNRSQRSRDSIDTGRDVAYTHISTSATEDKAIEALKAKRKAMDPDVYANATQFIREYYANDRRVEEIAIDDEAQRLAAHIQRIDPTLGGLSLADSMADDPLLAEAAKKLIRQSFKDRKLVADEVLINSKNTAYEFAYGDHDTQTRTMAEFKRQFPKDFRNLNSDTAAMSNLSRAFQAVQDGRRFRAHSDFKTLPELMKLTPQRLVQTIESEVMARLTEDEWVTYQHALGSARDRLQRNSENHGLYRESLNIMKRRAKNSGFIWDNEKSTADLELQQVYENEMSAWVSRTLQDHIPTTPEMEAYSTDLLSRQLETHQPESAAISWFRGFVDNETLGQLIQLGPENPSFQNAWLPLAGFPPNAKDDAIEQAKTEGIDLNGMSDRWWMNLMGAQLTRNQSRIDRLMQEAAKRNRPEGE